MLTLTPLWQAATVVLAGFLVLVGVAHFAVPGYFSTLVPPWPWLPGARPLVLVSGGVEVILGIGLFVDAARPLAAWGVVVLMSVYVATHLDALLRASGDRPRWLDRPAGASARVVVNLAYLGWALGVAIWASGPGG